MDEIIGRHGLSDEQQIIFYRFLYEAGTVGEAEDIGRDDLAVDEAREGLEETEKKLKEPGNQCVVNALKEYLQAT